ncbi:uncharacterized protein [Solanum lycopersicum]|uniref:uncharacterized protein n=1 Tax=Solanum lycopersicum TaxID=4081 RepID=UPI0037478F52
MTLFNPAIGKYKLIPNSLNKNLCSITSPIFGFAYDFVAEDYKVICAHYLINKYFNVVEVYSIKDQHWRTIHSAFPICPDDSSHTYLDDNQVSLNGVIYRMSYDKEIISFHLVDEKFMVTPVPRTCGERPKLHALGDGVCVFTTVGEENLIWSLEKDRWNCIHKFPTFDSLTRMSDLEPQVNPSYTRAIRDLHNGGIEVIGAVLCQISMRSQFKSVRVNLLDQVLVNGNALSPDFASCNSLLL